MVKVGGYSPKLGMVGKQNLYLPLYFSRRAFAVGDHTCVLVSAHKYLHVCAHTHMYRAGEKQSWLHVAEVDAVNLSPPS